MLEDFKKTANKVLRFIVEWKSNHGLAIAPEKMVVVVLSRKNYTALAMVVDEYQVQLSHTLKYTGMTLARTLLNF